MFFKLFKCACHLIAKYKRYIFLGGVGAVALMFIALGIGKIYQHWDKDPDRGAIAIENGAFGESYSTPVYLDQGWEPADSLWYYNTTQGSNLIPYDIYMSLELADSEEPFVSNTIYDEYRYLPQKPTFFNPDGLAVGFTKDEYQGKDYVGYTCAACHTSQVNFEGQAIRIDGGPAMADMVGYLRTMEKAMRAALEDEEKQKRLVEKVLARKGDFRNKDQVLSGLEEWTKIIQTYNSVNHSHVKYGYARLDAFGRIYNRVLQHVINRDQAETLMLLATNRPGGERMLTKPQVDLVLKGIDKTIIGNKQFSVILDRLASSAPGYPNLSPKQLMRLRKYFFNEPNAPVSYPFLWDITHSDYVQWNGLAGNSDVGPLGRNAGEVTGVFATLDWKTSEPGFNLPAKISGQDNKKYKIDFKSSIDLTNLQRLESQLKSLKSPVWPKEILGELNKDMKDEGRLIYAQYCESCHAVINRNDWNRIVVAQMSALESIGTDPAMAENSVQYAGYSGNFKDTYQGTGVGDFIVGDQAPVAMLLTATTKGVVATPDADKFFIRRWLDWLYVLGASLFDNDIKPSIKQGDYNPDTTASPFASLVAYKARSLNGIWATAPYLHNGSVPSLYDLLLPAKRPGDPEDGEYRPDEFMVGSREFNAEKVGFETEGYDGFRYLVAEFNEEGEIVKRRGNSNRGHEYAAGRTAQPSGVVLPPLNHTQRMQLLEYLKSL